MTFKYCGTPEGPKSHMADGEDCAFCKDWLKRGSPMVTPESLAPKIVKPKPVKVKRAKPVREREHGTMAGYRQHRTHKEPFCDSCREAFNADKRAYRDRLRAEGKMPQVKCYPPRGVRVHGSKRGAQQHRRNGEPVCDECKVGERAEISADRAARRAEAKQ